MSKLSSKIVYNEKLAALERVLSKLARPGEFYARGSVVTPLPKLEVDEVGIISFPLHPAQARELTEHATQAPYGRGEETIVDPNVRRVWQFNPSQFQLGGGTWADTLNGIVSQAAQSLGCEVSKVRAEPYKLLLYEKDGFFLSHRDTEKTEGMFGTLVVVLPSVYSGGDLVIRHAGREAVVDFQTNDISEISYVAFYADCQHEVRPIKSGNRLCLVYNLVHTGVGENALAAPENSAAIRTAGDLIREALEEPGAPRKLVYLLEHEYTPEGLSFHGLKNHDRAVGAVLAGAATQASCAFHLGIVHIVETGCAEISYSPQSRRRWRSYDDENDKVAENSPYVPIDISESEEYISEWRTAEGSKPEFGSIPLDDEELLPAGALDDEAPDSDRVTEATGNEGATFQRSYRRAALVLWKQNRYADVLLQSGIHAAMPYFKRIVLEGTLPPEELYSIAESIIERWVVNQHGYRSYDRTNEDRATRSAMLELLGKMGDADLIHLFLSEVVLEQYDGSENEALARNLQFAHLSEARRILNDLFVRYMPFAPKQCADLLGNLLRAAETETKRRAPLLVPLCATAVKSVPKVEPPNPNNYYRVGPQPQPFDAPSFAQLYSVVRTVADDQLLALAQGAAKNLDALPPDEVIAPALTIIAKKKEACEHPAFVLLWLHAATFLLQRSRQPPLKPADWARPVNLSAHCIDCMELQRFAADPHEQVHGFRIREDRRRHVEATIKSHRLDMTCRTEEKGSPKTLVCTKNLANYERECARHRKDVNHMKAILPLLEKAPDPAVTRTREELKAATM